MKDPITIFKLHFDGQWCAYMSLRDAIEEAQSILQEEDDDTEIKISVERMEREAVDAMPDFQGW